MDTDGSGTINIKELIDFLEAVGGGDIDKKIVKNAKILRKNMFLYVIQGVPKKMTPCFGGP